MCYWCGFALAIVELVDIHPMTRLDEEKAMCLRYPRANSFVLDNLYKFDEPMKAKGALYLWEIDEELIPGWSFDIEKAYRERFMKTDSKQNNARTVPAKVYHGDFSNLTRLLSKTKKRETNH